MSGVFEIIVYVFGTLGAVCALYFYRKKLFNGLNIHSNEFILSSVRDHFWTSPLMITTKIEGKVSEEYKTSVKNECDSLRKRIGLFIRN